MFTGLIEEIGTVEELVPLGDAVRIAVRAPKVTQDAVAGDSIAVDGVCLTVVDNASGTFTADVMRETLDRSRLGSYAPGSRVNLERALAAGQRMGGHIVQGHVDGVGTVQHLDTADRCACSHRGQECRCPDRCYCRFDDLVYVHRDQ